MNEPLSVLDHRRPGGDAEEGEGAGGGQEEAGADQTAAVQVSAQRAPRGQQLIRRSAEGGATVVKGAGLGRVCFVTCEILLAQVEHLNPSRQNQ